MEIKNSIAFVTGANRGLGLALARALLARGAAKVYAGVRNPAGIDEPGMVPVQLDVNDAESVRRAAAECADVTLLVNNAGIARLAEGTAGEGAVELAREIFETNYFGMLRMTQYFAPMLAARRAGAIVNVLSYASWVARAPLASYAASKAAAWSLTNALRVELKPSNVQVVGVHVGFIDTDLTKGFDVPKQTPESVADAILDGVQAGEEEILVDEVTREAKRTLSDPRAIYLAPPMRS